MLQIRKANVFEMDAVRAFYYAHIDAMEGAEYKTAWQKGVYPSDEMLLTALRQGELFVGELDGQIIAAMVINHSTNTGYEQVAWPTPAAREEVLVIHALGVLPCCGGKGYAKELVRFAQKLAQEQGQKALRLDVLVGNLPAEKLYIGAGFRCVERVTMYYEDTGWTEFDLYEYPV